MNVQIDGQRMTDFAPINRVSSGPLIKQDDGRTAEQAEYREVELRAQNEYS
jgi:hypothetical protein